MDKETIAAVSAGLVLVIGATANAVLSILARQDAKSAKKVAQVVAGQLTEVHDAVNGGNTRLLEQVARLTAEVAVLTGKPKDMAEADAAEHNAAVKRDSQAGIAARRNPTETKESGQ